ncbi:MAG TPA: amidohydrolase family protein [Jatrophihabitantaceae bacterium]
MRTLYCNGRVYDGNRFVARAILVDDGFISWLGEDEAAADAVGVRVVDLADALVTPAFVDPHVHCTGTGLALTGLDLSETASLSEALALVERAARAGRGRPVLGGGWDETRWPEQRPPTAAELDRAGYGGAVYLARIDVHSAAVSSQLLAGVRDLAGYDPSGHVARVAHDTARTAALAALTPSQTADLQRAALRHAASLGIACVHEMAGPAISSAEDLTSALTLARDEPLPEVIGYWGELFGIDTARELGAVGAAGDLFCDGSIGSHTAALHEPYADRHDTTGMVRFDTADVTEHVVRCVEAGLQAGFHAIGDAAVDQVLTAFELATERIGRPAGPGSRVEHAEYVRDPGRLAASGLVASMQPMFDVMWGGPADMYTQRLGAARAAALNRFADLAAAGVPLAFGSDAPVTPLGPWGAIRAAVRMHDPAAAVSVETALAAHTAGGWRAGGRPAEGRLGIGAPATFAVWDSPGRGLPELAAGGALPGCVATVRAGESIFDAGLPAG